MTLHKMLSRERTFAHAQASPGSLDDAARSINDHFFKISKAKSTADYHRVHAGRELVAVRKRIPHGEWEKWCRVNIQRSLGDIRKVIAIVEAPDPEAALDEERGDTCDRMKKHRTKSRARARDLDEDSTLSNVPNHVAFLARQFLALNEDDQQIFLALTGLTFLSKEKQRAG